MDVQLTLTEAIELFTLDNAARRLTVATRNQYINSLRIFVQWTEARGIVNLRDITPSILRTYLVTLNERTGRNSTRLSSEYVHGLARAVRRFLAYCVEDELLEQSPFRNLRMPRLEQKVLRALEPDEVQRVLSLCTYRRDKALIMFFLDTGIRANELCSLNVADIGMKDGAVILQKGKGQKGRWVYVGARARKALRLYLVGRERISGRDPLFASLRGGARLNTNAIVQIMRRLQKRSGIEHLTAHTLRRTFAITCLRNGMDIHSLRLLMGHSDIAMLRRYLDFAQSDLQGAHERHGPMDNLK